MGKGLQVQLGWRAPTKGMILPMGPVQSWEPAQLPIPGLGQTVAAVKTEAVKLMLVPATIAGLVSYVGFRLGKTDHGIPSVLGYAVGTLGALVALGSILVMVGVVKTPILLQPTTTEAIAKPQ